MKRLGVGGETLDKVAPYVGAWIETIIMKLSVTYLKSHPTWVRGLKPANDIYLLTRRVAPYVGAWIETNHAHARTRNARVAPYVGAWIETN